MSFFRKFSLLLFSLLCLSLHAQERCSPRHEVRAVWLTTLNGLDWPRKTANTPEAVHRQKKELTDLLDQYKEIGINTVIFQTRIRSTVAYPSAIEPWDGAFTGTPGRAPLYDPLAFVVEECHRRGLEVHAWVVAFPVGKVAAMKLLGRKALPQRKPTLCKRAGEEWVLDPGMPETGAYIASICGEIVRNYDVDGIHLDYIRYPEKAIPFNDNASYRRYGKGRNKAQWRRDNVTRCVRCIHDTVRAIRPWVKLSCSPVGKYSDLSRYSSYGWNARDAVSQDAKLWLREGLMDWLFPMMYFRGNHFYPFALDWKEGAAGHPVVPGLGIYFLDEREKDWPLEDIRRELNVCRQYGLGGAALFRSKFLTDNVKGLRDFLRDDFYHRPALLPPMTWIDSIAPPAPKTTIGVNDCEVRLSWEDVRKDASPAERVRYNIYCAEQEDAALDDATLLAVGLEQTDFTHCPALPHKKYAYYAVTATDVYGNESLPEFVRAKTTPGNPFPRTSGVLTLPATDADFLLIEDATGRKLLTFPAKPSIDVSRLAPGFYTLRTLHANGASHILTLFWKENTDK